MSEINYSIYDKRDIFLYALEECCKFLRKNPPGDLDQIFSEPGMIYLIAGGMARDPEGKEWMDYWVGKGIEKFERGKEDEIRDVAEG